MPSIIFGEKMFPGYTPQIIALQFQIGPTEIILVIILALILFGPKKLPELARSFGESIRVFKEETQRAMSSDEEASKKQETNLSIADEDLKKLAEKLGISAEGKSKEELVKEVLEKAKEKGLI
ncbi:Twin-arginine translocation protein TatA [Thermofilum adornatum 1505]|uniref:Sec-independent protein translocase protein TatA n=1 Tax=Thermofilum adornatum 1505 TaxID=697581 RepID=A0A3G1A7U4_9CREN|nr:twin-arginine translocase TatA/TatE family subunit [Thermofilum adornatum]AJB42278.1 Twin-arginine translocation protein TatA [Thermofilum adornatum 1505]